MHAPSRLRAILAPAVAEGACGPGDPSGVSPPAPAAAESTSNSNTYVFIVILTWNVDGHSAWRIESPNSVAWRGPFYNILIHRRCSFLRTIIYMQPFIFVGEMLCARSFGQ